jgi:hypothetical protein
MKQLLQKPLGIALTAIFCAFWGLLLVPVGYVTALAKGVRGAPHYAGMYGFLCMVLGVAMLTSAYGLWRMQNWGRWLALGIVAATIPISALGLLGISSGGKVSAGAVMSSLIGFALALGIARYLNRGHVRHMYKRPSILLEDKVITAVNEGPRPSLAAFLLSCWPGRNPSRLAQPCRR